MSFYYPHRFVQNFKGDSEHLKNKRLYTFKSTKSNLWYWVWVECYDYDIYAIKFHLKAHRHSPKRYNVKTSTFEPRVIVQTCINLFPCCLRLLHKMIMPLLALSVQIQKVNQQI